MYGTFIMSVSIIESAGFAKHILEYMDECEYLDFKNYLIANPFVGDLIPHTNGLRKVRWPSKNKGKRGGLRIIYFTRLTYNQIWLLSIYAKSETVKLSNRALKLLRDKVTDE